MIHEVIRTMQRLAIIQSDWSGTILDYNLQGLCGLKGILADNRVRIKNTRPEQISLMLEGHKGNYCGSGGRKHLAASIGSASSLPKLDLSIKNKKIPQYIYSVML